MHSTFFSVVLALLLAPPLACSESSGDDATAGGGSGSGTGGVTASGGSGASSGSGGSGAGGSGGAGASGGAVAGMAGVAGTGGASGDDRLFVPEDLPNTDLDGDGGLTLIAFTLVRGATGPELYAAVRNDGQTPACEAGMSIDFFDTAGALVTSAASTLQSGRHYRLGDGSGVLITCVPPGEVAMTASTELPDSLVIAELGHLEHRFPAFDVNGIVPVTAGLAVGDVEVVAAGSGASYTGTFTNDLDVAVMDPKVSVFPLNRVGRPVGVASASASSEVPAGGTWTFATGSVSDAGAGYAAFPSASISQ